MPWRSVRRQHRGRQDLHPGQRHGARHVLDPGFRGQAIRRPAAPAADCAARVELALSNRLDIQRELDSQRGSWPKRDQVFTVEPRVLIDNNASDTFTVIEVNGRDRPGFLHVVTRALTRSTCRSPRPHHDLRRARGRRVLRQGPVRPEGRECRQVRRQIAVDGRGASIRDFDTRFAPMAKAAD